MNSIRNLALALISAGILSGCTPGCPAPYPEDGADIASFDGREDEEPRPVAVRERLLRDPLPSEVSTSDLQ